MVQKNGLKIVHTLPKQPTGQIRCNCYQNTNNVHKTRTNPKICTEPHKSPNSQSYLGGKRTRLEGSQFQISRYTTKPQRN